MSIPRNLAQAQAQAHLGDINLFNSIRDAADSDMSIKINSLGNPEPVAKQKGFYRCGQKKENEIVRNLAYRSIECNFSKTVSEKAINEYKGDFNDPIYNNDNAKRYPCELINRYIGRAEELEKKKKKKKKEQLELKTLQLSAFENLKENLLKVMNKSDTTFTQAFNSLKTLLATNLKVLTTSQIKALMDSQANGLATSQMKELAKSQENELKEEVEMAENSVKQLLFDFNSGASCILIINSFTSVEPALRHLANTKPDINGASLPSLNNDIEEDLDKLTKLDWTKLRPFQQDGALQKFLRRTTPEHPIIAEVKRDDEQSHHWVVIVGPSSHLSKEVYTVLDPIHGHQSILISADPSQPLQEHNPLKYTPKEAGIEKTGQFTGKLIQFQIPKAVEGE